MIYSRVQYGIISWGTATNTRQKAIVLRLNNIVRIMTWSRKFDHVSVLYKQLKLLKLEDIYELELSKFMHQLNCNMTPKVFEKILLNFKVCIRTLQDKKLKMIISYPGSTKRCHKINWLFEELNCGQL